VKTKGENLDNTIFSLCFAFFIGINLYILILILQGKATFKRRQQRYQKTHQPQQNNPYTEENRELKEYIKIREKVWKKDVSEKTKQEQTIIDAKSV
jgi:hypothetical protein